MAEPEWDSITHRDGEVAEETIDLLNERGPLATMQHLVLNLDRPVGVEDSDDIVETYADYLPTYGNDDRIDVAGDFVVITNTCFGTIHLLREVPPDTARRSRLRKQRRWRSRRSPTGLPSHTRPRKRARRRRRIGEPGGGPRRPRDLDRTTSRVRSSHNHRPQILMHGPLTACGHRDAVRRDVRGMAQRAIGTQVSPAELRLRGGARERPG